MFLGHGLFAFALIALLAERANWSSQRALTAGLVAAGFATLPDIDVVYAIFAIDTGIITDVNPDPFWAAAEGIHRTVTHSLIVAIVAGPAFGAWTARSNAVLRGGAVVVLVGVVTAVTAIHGYIGLLVTGLFVLVGLLMASIVRERSSIGPITVAAIATVALLSHPWGDLLAGTPPDMLYPLETTLFEGRIILHGDPTIHLLAAFALELGLAWVAGLTAIRLAGVKLRPAMDRRALLASGYGIVVLAFPPPTVDLAYQFVYSIIAVGLFVAALTARSLQGVRLSLGWSDLRNGASLSALPDTHRHTLANIVITALSAVTIALMSYAVVYTVVNST